MTTLLPDLQPRGLDHSLSSCGGTHCSSHGSCVFPTDDGIDMVCDCDLGYQGQYCEDTVNGALSMPLTLGVLAVILGLVILAFIVAKLRQRQKKNRRHMAAKHGYNIAV